MDTLVEVGSILSSLVNTFWTTLVASYGILPTTVITILLVIGVYTSSKFIIKWIINKFKKTFKKEEVILLPQTYVAQ